MSDMSLRAFMLSELKEEEVIEYPGVETFKGKDGKPIPLKIRALSRKRINEIRKSYRTKKILKDKKGNPIVNGNMAVYAEEYDAERAGAHILVEAIVYPKLNDPELMEFYGAVDAMEMPDKVFKKADDYAYVNKCVVEACGLGAGDDEDEDEVEEIKN